ncbi:hypothetical protein DPMN_009662 [Dreissena polymorpha]|uniref:C17orf113 probable zinc finger domain-containing protein n=1 Tax=Dreissena polymorpha TaxID=45954 RepID=A0A9D4MXC9_DREPO|nr:hypothetical protein DPMN_009662 [Dreissena polymorpha]
MAQRKIVAWFQTQLKLNEKRTSEPVLRAYSVTGSSDPGSHENRSGKPDSQTDCRLEQPISLQLRNESCINETRIVDSNSEILSSGCGNGTDSVVLSANPLSKRKRDKSPAHGSKKARHDSSSESKHFTSSWLSKFSWLQYYNGAMLCTLCIKHNNLSKFTSDSTNFRKSTLKDHENKWSQNVHANGIRHVSTKDVVC